MDVKRCVFVFLLATFMPLARADVVAGSMVPDTAFADGTFLSQMAQGQVNASRTAARLAQVRQQAARIKIGTSRAQIEALFSSDGGLMMPTLGRYYAGEGVMVDVPYDLHSGAWRAQNRVRGPLRVYLSPLHCD